MLDLYLCYNVPLLRGQYGDDNQRWGVDSAARYLVVCSEIKGDRVCGNTKLQIKSID
jgi:hypothetical protein